MINERKKGNNMTQNASHKNMEILQAVPLFANLSDAELEDVACGFVEKTFSRGDYLFQQGDPGDALFIILAGAVKVVSVSGDGNENILAILGRKDFLGEMAVLDGADRSASAQSIRHTSVLMLTRESFYDVILAHPLVSISLLKELCARIRLSNQHVDDLMFCDATTRLDRTLRALARSYGVEGYKHKANDTYLNLRISHRELANLIGVRRETVTRILSKWKKAGLTKTDGRYLILTPKWFSESL